MDSQKQKITAGIQLKSNQYVLYAESPICSGITIL